MMMLGSQGFIVIIAPVTNNEPLSRIWLQERLDGLLHPKCGDGQSLVSYIDMQLAPRRG
ncbi:hypothetical protein P154DRAFT_525914 [Amniculicola lignicola CBS 123094]|uniref:Uncharacterized protein n=1 Tax=Amniculicola lignicola CBS 123094 TaxID=1392246 RepID=A0A6A5W4V1_9PLEO|nr:hypothetical protein P154DRAFT_525914 [Amniculicola lignicola CBS 123094]